MYGFYDECKRRYSIKLWRTFAKCFDCLPIAAIIDERIFTVPGGLNPDLNSMAQIRRIMRPTNVSLQFFISLLAFSPTAERPLEALVNNVRFLTAVFYVICCGPSQTKISPAGGRATEVFPSHLGQMSFLSSFRSMT